MTFMLTVQENETTRRSWELDSGDVVALKPLVTGVLVKTKDGKETEVLEGLEDIGLQCDAGGVALPTVEG